MSPRRAGSGVHPLFEAVAGDARRHLQLAAFFRCSNGRQCRTFRCRAGAALRPGSRRRRRRGRWFPTASTQGGRGDPRRIDLLRSPRGTPERRRPSCRRSAGTSGWRRPRDPGAIRRLMDRPRPRRACCRCSMAALADAEVVSLIEHAWPRLTQPQRARRSRCCSRARLLDRADPGKSALTCSAGVDRPVSGSARADAARHQQPAALWSGEVRRHCCSRPWPTTPRPCAGRVLTLARAEAGLWNRPDAARISEAAPGRSRRAGARAGARGRRGNRLLASPEKETEPRPWHGASRRSRPTPR